MRGVVNGGVVTENRSRLDSLAGSFGSLIGIEANLEVPPMFQMRRTDPNRRFEECTTVVVTDDGERLEQYWRISVPEPYTLPGAFDQDVWVAVQALINRRGGMPPDGKLYFSMYELLEIMGKNHRGRHYEQLKDSLNRLAATSFHSDNAFYLKDTEDYETMTFSPWAVRLRKTVRRKSRKETERHELEFHSLVRRSFQADYLKVLDSDFYYSLRSPLAKRLYRLIDRKRQGGQRWGTSLNQLKMLAPLAESYRYPSKIKDVLRPAHKELLERGFLSEVDYRTKSSGEHVLYTVSGEFDRCRSLEPAEPDLSAEDQRAVELLASRGVWPNVAPDLVSRWGASTCIRYAHALQHMNGIKDPGAWLRWAIEHQQELPGSLQTQPRLLEERDGGGSETEVVGEGGAPSGSFEISSGRDMPEASPEAADTLGRVLDDLQLSGTTSVRLWFDSCTPVSVHDDVLTLVVPNSFAKEYIEDRFANDLARALRHRLGPGAGLRVTDLGSYS